MSEYLSPWLSEIYRNPTHIKFKRWFLILSSSLKNSGYNHVLNSGEISSTMLTSKEECWL